MLKQATASMITAASEHDANGVADNMCSFVLLSDGYENTAPLWEDVRPDVVDNGCAIHSIALGPQARQNALAVDKRLRTAQRDHANGRLVAAPVIRDTGIGKVGAQIGWVAAHIAAILPLASHEKTVRFPLI